ncbi:MAG: carboxypeptidase-like regulatory domain-containing protein [Bacteroidota bacterium]
MKLSILFLSLLISAAGFSQSRDFDFVLEIDQNNSILLQNKEVSKHMLKKVFRSFQGEEPNIQLKSSEVVSQTQIERIKRLASNEFDSYFITFDVYSKVPQKAYKYYINGTVKSLNDQPLKHINVIADGTATGLVTDENGHFKIGIPKGTKSLVVEHKDYSRFELPETELSSLRDTENMVIILSPR